MDLVKRFSNLKNIYFNLFKPRIVPWDELKINTPYRVESIPPGYKIYKGDPIFIVEKNKSQMTILKAIPEFGGDEVKIKKVSLMIHALIYYHRYCSLIKIP
jgi:hypothetical protein